MTSKKLLAHTSLRGSAGGITRSSSQGGRQTQKSGPDLVPANPLATQAKEKALRTSAICGPSGLISLSPADPLSSLASKLSARLAGSGGTLYRLTWKVWDTPQERSIYALRASGHRTSGNGCSGWATPQAHDTKGAPGAGAMARGGFQTNNPAKVQEAVWRAAGAVWRAAGMAGWATPTAAQLGNTLESYQAMKANMTSGKRTVITHLNLKTELIGWATPTTRDWKDGAAEGTAPINALLGRQAWLTHAGPVVLRASGPSPIGYTAETVNGDRLNPEHSRWLMGYPAEWANCAPTETRSSLKRRQP